MSEMNQLVSMLEGDGSWSSWLIAINLWTGALLVVAYLADRLLRRHVRPAWRIALYAIVLVRIGLPADWESPVSVVPAEPTGVEVAATNSALVGPDAPVLVSELDDEPAAAAPAATNAGWSDAQVFGLIYLLGAATLLGGLVVARRRLARTVASSRSASTRLRALAGEAPVREHGAAGPLTFGILSPVIIMPAELSETLSDEELRCVLDHERAHLRRKDPALALFIAVLTALLWPVLPVWLAGRRVRQLMELSADELALANTAARTYGQTLLKLADRQPMRLASAVSLPLGGFRDLRGRIAGLRQRSRLPRPVQLGLVASVATGALACAGLEDGTQSAEDLALRCEELKQRATVKHDESEKAGDQSLRLAAIEAYEAYADECESDPDYAEVRYYEAEARWAVAVEYYNGGDKAQGKQWFDRAHETFVLALDAQPGRFTKDAAYAQMLAKKNALEWEDQPSERSSLADEADSKFPVSDYDERELELLASYDTYERHVTDPADPELRKVRYHRAKLAMKHNRFDDARPALLGLLSDSDGNERDVHAAEMLLDVLTIAWVDPEATDAQRGQAGRELEEFASRLPKMDLYKHAKADKLREAVPTLLAGISWKRGMTAHAAGRHDECADTFLALADRHPDHERLDAVLWNAATCLSDGGRDDEARTVAKRLIADFPDSERAAEARALLQATR